MLRITWTPSTGAAVTVLYNRQSGLVKRINVGPNTSFILGTVTRGAHGGFMWQRQSIIESRNGGPTIEMAVWALCAQCRKDGTV